MLRTGESIRQIMDFNKNVFDNTFNAIMNIGEQNEKMFRTLVDQTWLPDEGKNAVLESINIYRKGWTDFKKATDETYKTMVKYLGEDEKNNK